MGAPVNSLNKTSEMRESSKLDSCFGANNQPERLLRQAAMSARDYSQQQI